MKFTRVHHCPVIIVPGASCTDAQRRSIAVALIAENSHEYPDWTVEQATAEVAAPGPLPMTFVVIENGIPIGCASLLDDDEVTGWGGREWLANVVVVETARGRGVGTALVDAVEQHARAIGLPELHLVTSTAVRWYEAKTWSVVGEADVHGHPMNVMRKQIT